MGLLDRLFGRRGGAAVPSGYGGNRGYGGDAPGPTVPGGRSADEQAIERYRYLLRTARPDQIEEAHAEAFAKLTTDQRRQVLEQLSAAVPENERPRADDARSLARAATRAEVRQPGILERAFGGGGFGSGGYRGGYGPGYGGGYGPGYGGGYGPGYGGGYGPGYGGGYGYGGPSFGSMVGGSLLGTVGGLVIGSAVADALFDTGLGDGGLFGGGDEEAYAAGYGEGYQDGDRADGGDPGGDYGGDGGDYGGDYGGDFGGGDDYGGGGDF